MVNALGTGRREAAKRWRAKNPEKHKELLRQGTKSRTERRRTDPAYAEAERKRWRDYRAAQKLNTCQLLLSKLESPPHDPETLFNEESLTKILGPVEEP